MLAGSLAALTAAGVIAARRPVMRTSAAVGLLAGLTLGMTLLATRTGNDGDTDIVAAIASVLGEVSGLILVLVVWRVMRGPGPHRVRRALIWSTVIITAVLISAVGTLDNLAEFASHLLQTSPGEFAVGGPTWLGTFVVALVIAALVTPCLASGIEPSRRAGPARPNSVRGNGHTALPADR
jgi:hypothetical protein